MITFVRFFGVIQCTERDGHRRECSRGTLPQMRTTEENHMPGLPGGGRARAIARVLAVLMMLSAQGTNSGAQDVPVRGFAPGQLRIGLTYDATRFPNFERVVGDQVGISSYSADKSTRGIGGQLEYRPWSSPLAFRAGVNYGVQDFTQTFSSTNPLAPRRAEGRVRGLFADFVAAWFFDMDPFALSLGGGVAWARNDSEFDSFYDGFDEPIRRRHTGFLPTISGAVDWQVRRRLGVRATVDHLGTFNARSADDHYRVRAGLTYLLGGRD